MVLNTCTNNHNPIYKKNSIQNESKKGEFYSGEICSSASRKVKTYANVHKITNKIKETEKLAYFNM